MSWPPRWSRAWRTPGVDGYWQAYQIAMVLAGRWEQRTFVAEAAHYFRHAGVVGWQPAGGQRSEVADLGVREGGTTSTASCVARTSVRATHRATSTRRATGCARRATTATPFPGMSRSPLRPNSCARG